MVTVDNIDHTQFIVWISSLDVTIAGVIAWPAIVPSNGENAKNTVTKICSLPANQFWLTYWTKKSLNVILYMHIFGKLEWNLKETYSGIHIYVPL